MADRDPDHALWAEFKILDFVPWTMGRGLSKGVIWLGLHLKKTHSGCCVENSLEVS